MRDNDNNREPYGLEGGMGQVRPVDWTRTEAQISSHEGFAPESIKVRNDDTPGSSASPPTMRLARPPAWTHRDDLMCTTRVPTDNGPDQYDTTDPLVAKALCAGCPREAKRACLAAAMEEEEGLGPRSRYLVRGGLTGHARGVLAQKDQQAETWGSQEGLSA